MSPRSQSAGELVTVPPAIAAGTMIQAARGAVSLARELRQRARAGGALALELRDRGLVDVVDDALVAVPHQAPHDVGPHAAEADHSELHDRVPPAVV